MPPGLSDQFRSLADYAVCLMDDTGPIRWLALECLLQVDSNKVGAFICVMSVHYVIQHHSRLLW